MIITSKQTYGPIYKASTRDRHRNNHRLGTRSTHLSLFCAFCANLIFFLLFLMSIDFSLSSPVFSSSSFSSSLSFSFSLFNCPFLPHPSPPDLLLFASFFLVACYRSIKEGVQVSSLVCRSRSSVDKLDDNILAKIDFLIAYLSFTWPCFVSPPPLHCFDSTIPNLHILCYHPQSQFHPHVSRLACSPPRLFLPTIFVTLTFYIITFLFFLIP